MYLFAGENDVHNISGQLVINDEFLVLYGLSCTIYFIFFFYGFVLIWSFTAYPVLSISIFVFYGFVLIRLILNRKMIEN